MNSAIAPVYAAVEEALRADAGVIAAFGSAPVKVHGLVPVNAVPPYLVLGLPSVLPIQAEGFDLGEMEFTVHVWSCPDPPSLSEGLVLAAAVETVLAAIEVSSGARVYAALPVRTQALIDPGDDRTVHVIVTFRFTTAPA